jgi:hypothetical protein
MVPHIAAPTTPTQDGVICGLVASAARAPPPANIAWAPCVFVSTVVVIVVVVLVNPGILDW